jgi:hypothetical protein
MRGWTLGLFLALPGGAAALPVFDNGIGPADLVAGDVRLSDATASSQRVADDFSFASDQAVTGVRFYGAYFPGNAPAADAFTIQFYESAAGLPIAPYGAPIAPSVTRVDTGFDWSDGVLGPIDIYEFEASFPTFVFGSGLGAFWMSIVNDTAAGPDDFVLITLAGSGGMAISQDAGASWEALGASLGFVLLPEPGLLLLAAGGAIAVLRRSLGGSHLT